MSTNGYRTEVLLGSNGFLYEDKLSDGKVICKPWGTSEEMLLNSSINPHILMDKLIDSCCELPEGLKAEDLTTHDRFLLFFHQRNISYPRPYTFPYRCSECNQKAYASINLAEDLEIRLLGQKPKLDEYTGDAILGSDGKPETESTHFEEPILVTLPLSGKTIGWRFLRGKDEKKIEKYEHKVRQRNPHLAGDASYAYTIAMQIVSIDGEESKFSEVLEFVRHNLVGDDSLTLRDSFDEWTHGVIPSVEPECNHCGYLNGPFALPFDSSFFRPKGNGRNTS